MLLILFQIIENIFILTWWTIWKIEIKLSIIKYRQWKWRMYKYNQIQNILKYIQILTIILK